MRLAPKNEHQNSIEKKKEQIHTQTYDFNAILEIVS